MPLHDLDDFLRLSEVLNLQLSVKTVGWSNIASIITYKTRLSQRDRDVLMQVLHYLDSAYGQRRRRLGPLSVLHPLRATALLVRAMPIFNPLDVLTSLLHDKLEDLTPGKLGETNWRQLENSFQVMLKTIDPKDEWFLMERIDWLTRRENETYFQYIGRLLSHAHQTPELVRIKLADRLDNTLDMHVYIEDPLKGVDFFATVFQILFVNCYAGHKPPMDHAPSSPLSSAERLYQLFKNVVLLSLVRQRLVAPEDPTAEALVEALSLASMQEAQRIILDIFGYHQQDTGRQRELLLGLMDYVHTGHIDKVNFPHGESRLDRLFFSHFEVSDPQKRKIQLQQLYQDKELMVEGALAFVVIFQSFLNDPHYFVKGVS